MIGWALRQLAIWSGIAFVGYALIGNLRPGDAVPPSEPAAPATATQARAAVPNSLAFHAGKQGHVLIDATVNGVPVRFLVDTGASAVALTIRDAEAAGISRGSLNFNLRTVTANGVSPAAAVSLREVRIGQLAIGNVRATVHENLGISLLGQSFLTRLDSYEMRDGVLTFTYW